MAQRELFKPHRNHFLFSDYYLDHRIAGLREWQDADPRQALERIAAL
jgi:hypothetical protein